MAEWECLMYRHLHRELGTLAYICNPRDPMERREMGTGEPMEAHCKQRTREPVSNKVAGKDLDPWLSSDLDKCIHTTVYTHTPDSS